jgi:hypothetical protein
METGWMRSEPGCRRRRPTSGTAAAVLALGFAVVLGLGLAACSPGPAHSQGSASPAVRSACAQVGGALSDGPDPGADPVGYAEAQIRPLRAIKITNQRLRIAVSELASGYAAVFASNGKSAAATRTVAAATKKVNAVCKGAAS